MKTEKSLLGNGNNNYESIVDTNPSLLQSATKGGIDDTNRLLLKSTIGGDVFIDCNINKSKYHTDDDDSYEDDYEQQQIELQFQHDHHAQNRFIILAVVVITPMGVKFFKSAQSSFQEYLMNDTRIMMSATTYSLMLSLMSIPAATLIGGLLLDYNHRENPEYDKNEQKDKTINKFISKRSLSCLGTTRTPSYSAIAFIALSFLGIIIYGYGLEVMNNQAMALIGAAIFGLGEGCVVVASRTFVAHAFYGSEGAFAQGLLVATNNLAMAGSKVIIPWLIENKKKSRVIDGSSNSTSNDNDISIGIVACCVAMLMSLLAGIIYASCFGASSRPQHLQQHQRYHVEPQEPGEPSREMVEKKEEKRHSKSIITSIVAYWQKLPLTFWIVAVGRAIFVVTFKVFSHNSNSILMEKFGVDAVAAGRKSSLHEIFALGSPLVGYLAYRSPCGIVIWLFGSAILGTVSIAAITYLSAETIQELLPGGVLTPLAGVSVAHGIFIPICIAVIPLTVPEEQIGMAFAVVEVLGSIFGLTNIVFGWLRDTTGYYHVPMELLFVYSLVGTCLVWVSRRHIKLEQPNE